MNYTVLAERALALLESYGVEVQLNRLDRSQDYDDETATVVTTPSQVNVHAVFTKVGTEQDRVKVLEASNVMVTRYKVILSAIECGQQLLPGDYLVRDGKRLVVETMDEVNPAATPLIYIGFVLG